MEFANIEGYNGPAIAIWGTKRGKQTFFGHAVKGVDNDLIDVRTPVQFSRKNLIFYSFGQTANYQCFTIYHTILDWVNRPGYYAVSLLCPADKKLSENPLALLKSLSQIYWDKYIKTSAIADRIDEKARESPYYFISEIQRQGHTLEQGSHIQNGSKKAVFRYKNEAALEEFFDNHRHTILNNYEAVYLLPQTETGLSCSYDLLEAIDFKNPAKTCRLTVRVYDKETRKPLDGARVSIFKNDEELASEQVNGSRQFSFDKSEQDHMRFIVARSGYQRFDTMSKGNIFRENGEGATLAVPLEMTEDTKATKQRQIEEEVEADEAKRKKMEIDRQQPQKSAESKIKESIPEEVGFFEQHQKNIRVAGVALLAIVVMAVVAKLVSSPGKTTNDWTARTQNITRLAAKITAENWNAHDYKIFRDTLVQQKKELALTDTTQATVKGTINLNLLEEQMQARYRAILVKVSKAHLRNLNFNLEKTKELLADTKKHGINVTHLAAYYDLCLWVQFADKLITEGNQKQRVKIGKDGYLPRTILSSFRGISSRLLKGKYAFLTSQQKITVRLYADVVAFYVKNGTNNPASLADFKRQIVYQVSKNRLTEINTFLQSRGIE